MSNETRRNADPKSWRVFGFFTNLRIGIKIFVGFAAVLGLTAILAATSVSGFGKVSGGFANFSQRAGVVGIVLDVDLEFTGFRRFVREYSLAGNESIVEEAQKKRMRVSDAIALGLREIKNPERLAKMVEIGKQFELYSKEFDKLIDLRRDQNNLTKDVLDPLGLKIHVEIEKLQATIAKISGNTNSIVLASEVQKQMLLARLNVNKLLGRHDQTSAEGAEKALLDLKVAMLDLSASIDNGDAQKLFSDVNANVEKYTQAYHKAAHDAHEIEALVNGAMASVAQAIAADAKAVKDSGIADEKQIGWETESQIASTQTLVLTVTIVNLLIGTILAWSIGRAISKPVVRLCTVMRELAGGNLSLDIGGVERRDEIGEMARTVEVFKANALEVERLKEEQQALEQRAAEQRKADMKKLADEFESAVGEIIETVSSASTELEAAAGTLTSTADRTQQLTTTVAAASEQASTNVQSVASATEEMASSVNEISRQVQESAKIAGEAVGQARKTNDRVEELARAASRIGDVVDLINTIAGQTNLLALNATIEAARAGEAGRGFAVVASEVKALAEQTGKATGEISQQIAGMQAATQDSVVAIKEIGGTIERMSEISSTIASAVEEQGAATQEISRNVQQAALGTTQVSANISDVQRGATETGSASSQVLSAAQSLSRDSNRLKIEVGKFMNTVRAA